MRLFTGRRHAQVEIPGSCCVAAGDEPYIYIYIHMYLYTVKYIDICTNMYIDIYVCVDVYMCNVYMYIHMYESALNLYVLVYRYVCTYA